MSGVDLSDGQAGLVRRVLNRPLANANTCLHQAVSVSIIRLELLGSQKSLLLSTACCA